MEINSVLINIIIWTCKNAGVGQEFSVPRRDLDMATGAVHFIRLQLQLQEATRS